MGRRMEMHQQSLVTRKAVIEAFLRDVVPLPRDDVVDPLVQIENVADHEHEE